MAATQGLLSCAAVVVLSLGSAAAADCSAEARRVSVAKAAFLDQNVSVNAVRQLVADTQSHIEQLGFKTTLGNLKDWRDTGEQEIALAKEHRWDGWVKLTFAAGSQVIENVPLPRIKYPNRTIAKLRKLGIEDRELSTLIRDFYGAKGRAEQTEAWEFVVERLGQGVETGQLFRSVGQSGDSWEFAGKAAALVLSFGLEDPELGAFANTLEAAEEFMQSLGHSLATGILVEPRLDDFTKLSEEQLRGWSSLNKLLVKNVAELRTAQLRAAKAKDELDNANRALQACSPVSKQETSDGCEPRCAGVCGGLHSIADDAACGCGSPKSLDCVTRPAAPK
jgi:hypothetical protein